MSRRDILWKGELDGKPVRIVRMNESGCVVEVKPKDETDPGVEDSWEATDDVDAISVYEKAVIQLTYISHEELHRRLKELKK